MASGPCAAVALPSSEGELQLQLGGGCPGEGAPSRGRKWHSVLAELQAFADSPAGAQGEARAGVLATAQLLTEARTAVLSDPQWELSGIAQMLQRALEM
jgi:hypothetical protein